MPDTLSEQLDESRRRLLDAIHQPELSTIAARATRRRNRRRAAAGTTALVLAVAVGLGVTQPWQGGGTPPRPDVAASAATATVMAWTDHGVTINGLPGEAGEVDGDIYAIEFVDPDRGYLLAAECAGGTCAVTFATTTDGGRAWTVRPVPVDNARIAEADLPVLLTLGDRVAVVAGVTRYSSGDGGRSWVTDPAGTPGALAAIPEHGRPHVDAGCTLSAWTPRWALPVALAVQPALSSCRAAPEPAADGAWWLAGLSATGTPELAVSRDGGGRWAARPLPAEPGAAEVAVTTLGAFVYAVVLDPGRRILAVYRSTDRGATFARLGGAQQITLRGDPVPLLDGRLVVVGDNGRWYAGETGRFTALPSLLTAGRLARTGAGYVAYDLLDGGWCAYSTDGATWRKINAR